MPGFDSLKRIDTSFIVLYYVAPLLNITLLVLAMAIFPANAVTMLTNTTAGGRRMTRIS
ncbi:hypothetical protein SK128_010056, partial [Halocaridina rubra]